MTAAEVLDVAADRIECAGRFQASTEQGKYCPVTAIWQGRQFDVAAHAAIGALYLEVGPIIEWNDNEPDDAVVLATMRNVAAQLRWEAGE